MINKFASQVSHKHRPSLHLVHLNMYHSLVLAILFATGLTAAAAAAAGQVNNATVNSTNVTTTFFTTTTDINNNNNNNTATNNNATTIPTTRIAGTRPFGQMRTMNTLIVHLVKQPNRTLVENISGPSETSTIDPRAAQCTDGQTFWNGTGCHTCTRQCPSGAYMTRRCVQGSDMECQCHKGAYLAADGQCKTCSECASGWGVWRTCRWSRDTVCRKCQPGTFSGTPVGSLGCITCSKCAPNQQLVKPCGGDQDTLCIDINELVVNNRVGQDEEDDEDDEDGGDNEGRLPFVPPQLIAAQHHSYEHHDNAVDRVRGVNSVRGGQHHQRRTYHQAMGNTNANNGQRPLSRGKVTPPEAVSMDKQSYLSQVVMGLAFVCFIGVVIYTAFYYQSITRKLDNDSSYEFAVDEQYHQRQLNAQQPLYRSPEPPVKMMAPPGTATRILTQSCYLGGCQQQANQQQHPLIAGCKMSPLVFPSLSPAVTGIVFPPPTNTNIPPEPVMHSLYQKPVEGVNQPVPSSSVASSISANDLSSDTLPPSAFRRHKSFTKSYYALLYPPTPNDAQQSAKQQQQQPMAKTTTVAATTIGVTPTNAGNSIEKRKRTLTHEMKQMLENRLGKDERSWKLLAAELGYSHKQIVEIEKQCSTLDRNQTMIDTYKAIRLVINDWCQQHTIKTRMQQQHSKEAGASGQRPLLDRSNSQVSTFVRALIRIHRGDCARLLSGLTKPTPH